MVTEEHPQRFQVYGLKSVKIVIGFCVDDLLPIFTGGATLIFEVELLDIDRKEEL